MATPLSQQFPQIYQDWINAGGAEDNFRAHLLAIPGGVTPTAADLGWLANHTAIAVTQMQDATAKFGAATGMTTSVVVVSQSLPGT